MLAPRQIEEHKRRGSSSSVLASGSADGLLLMAKRHSKLTAGTADPAAPASPTARGGPSPLGPAHQRGEAAYISWCQVAARTESSSPPVRPDPHPARAAVGPAVGPAKTPSLSESGRRNIQCAAFGRVRVAAAGMWRNSRLQSLCFDAAAQSPR